jgi:HK97 family phage major capsid protein
VTSQVAVTAATGSIKNLSGDDLLNLAMGVAAKYRKGGAYFMHPTVLAYLTQSMKNLDGDYILRTPREDGLAATIWGYPVIESEVFPTTDAVSTKVIAFANPKRLFFADRAQMEIAVSDSATLSSGGNMFQINSTAIRTVERVGLGWTIGVGTAMLSTAAA